MTNISSAIESKQTHIFMDCIITKQILDQFAGVLKACVDINTPHKEMAFGIFEYTNNKTNFKNYLTFTIRYIVYRNRNNEFLAKANITQILRTNNKIHKNFELKFNIAKRKTKLHYLRKGFWRTMFWGN